MSAGSPLPGLTLYRADRIRPRALDVSRVVAFLAAGTALALVAWSAYVRGSLARELTWQCDELPLLMRFTGLAGKAAHEAEARAYAPSFYHWRMGALRALRAPAGVAALHTTTHFWVNLSTHVFGVTPLAGRLMPLFWSLAAVATGAWAAWTITRDAVAAGAAAVLLALSPHLTAYGAQARGYAEAAALAPVLPVLLDKLRRGPHRAGLAVAALAVAIQLSLTVYTAWLYWALPVMLAAWWALPRGGGLRAAGAGADRPLRCVLTLLVAALAAVMAVFTLDRWNALTFTAGHMGVPLEGAGDVRAFLALTAREMIPISPWLALLGAAGAVVAWRTPGRWWLACVGGSLSMVLLLAVGQGRGGYPRNFGVLLGPAAVLVGCGAGEAWRAARAWAAAGDANMMTPRGRRRSASLAIVGLAIVAAAAVPAAAGLRQRAEDLLLPDWGAMVQELDREGGSFGPRWVCPCLANHWTIHWYRPAGDRLRHILDRSDGGAGLEGRAGGEAGRDIEVILGAEFDEFGRPTLYREDVERGAIVPDRVPPYLAASPVWRTRHGIELRRWRGVPADPATRPPIPATPRDGLAPGAADAPALIYLELQPAPPPEKLKRFLLSIDAWSAGVVTFKSVVVEGRAVASLIAPRRLIPTLLDASGRDLDLPPERVHLFLLEPAAGQS